MYYVYIIECSNKALYTGITNDLERRFAQHQTGKGCRYTSYNPAVKLRYFEKHRSRSAAAKRECQIKSWPRAKKLALIKGDKEFLKAALRV
jgi:putative endonuclease